MRRGGVLLFGLGLLLPAGATGQEKKQPPRDEPRLEKVRSETSLRRRPRLRP